MEKIFEAAKKYTDGENVEVFMENWDEDTVDFEMDKLKQIKSRNVTGYGLRMIRDGRMGFAGGTASDAEGLAKAAADSAKYGPEVNYKFPKNGELVKVENFDEKILSLSPEDMVEKGREILEYLKEKRPEFQYSITANRYIESKRILNGSFDRDYKRTIYTFMASAHSFREGDFFNAGDGYAMTLMESREKEIADSVLEILELASREVTMKAGRYPVIFSPRAFRDILQPLLIGLNGRAVEKGSSPLTDKMGEKVINPMVTLWDDGTLKGCSQSVAFDDEGLPVKRRLLVEDGVLRSYILDLSTAANLGLESTGNAQRSYPDVPRPSTHAVIFREGEKDPDEMIREIDEGLYVEEFIGSHSGNPYSGDFQLNIDKGFKIEKGNKTGRVKNAMIAGNIYKLFDSLAQVSGKGRWMGKYFLPHTLFENVAISL